jgi:hypothetical protein
MDGLARIDSRGPNTGWLIPVVRPFTNPIVPAGEKAT